MTSDVANIQLEYNLQKASLPASEHSDDNNNRAGSGEDSFSTFIIVEYLSNVVF